MEKCIKELRGHSGSKIYLMINDKRRFVRKIGNVERNYERLTKLKDHVSVPEIYFYDGKQLDMEYIYGYDMKTYLLNNDPSKLIEFLTFSIKVFMKDAIKKDYTNTYETFLSFLDTNHPFSFTKHDLINRLPKNIIRSDLYNGDMTLENVLCSREGKFYFIDTVTTPFDSFVFDWAKLNQDVNCKWFLRHDRLFLDSKLLHIRDRLLSNIPELREYDLDVFLILMLLRVYLHCDKNSLEYDFIIREVNRLWK